MALALMALVAAACGGGSETPPSPTAEVTVSPGASPSPGETATLPVATATKTPLPSPPPLPTIAGITIRSGGSGLTHTHDCTSREHPSTTIAFEDVNDRALAIRTEYLPLYSRVEETEALACDGEPQAVWLWLLMQADPNRDGFDTRVSIAKAYALPDVSSTIPSYRWVEGSVGGYPAAVAPPTTDKDPESGVLVYKDGIILSLVAHGPVTLDQLVYIAEGQLP